MLAGWHHAQKVHLTRFILVKFHGHNILINILHKHATIVGIITLQWC